MGLMAASLKDMDSWEVSRKRKPLRKNASKGKQVNVIMWTVDGAAVLADPPRGRSECCANALWRRMMCARNVSTIKGGQKPGQEQARISDECHSDSDRDLADYCYELAQPQKPRLWADVGPKLQTAFGMRRWPQGWI